MTESVSQSGTKGSAREASATKEKHRTLSVNFCNYIWSDLPSDSVLTIFLIYMSHGANFISDDLVLVLFWITTSSSNISGWITISTFLVLSPARWSTTVQPYLFLNSSKVQCVPLTITPVKLVTILYELTCDPNPVDPKSQRFQRSQLVDTCSFSSKTTNKRSLIPFFVELCHSMFAFPWCQLWECLTRKSGYNSSPDVPLSLASECRLVIRRALNDTRPSTVASLGKDGREVTTKWRIIWSKKRPLEPLFWVTVSQVWVRGWRTSWTSFPGTPPSSTPLTPFSHSPTEHWSLPARKRL